MKINKYLTLKEKNIIKKQINNILNKKIKLEQGQIDIQKKSSIQENYIEDFVKNIQNNNKIFEFKIILEGEFKI